MGTKVWALEDLCFTPAIELAARIQRRELSPVELTIGNVAAGTPRYSWYPYTRATFISPDIRQCRFRSTGRFREELPIGLQIVGPWHAEDRMISAAALLEEIASPG